MRIGEINKDNYMDYVKLFGGKNTKALEQMWGKDEKSRKSTNNNAASSSEKWVNPYEDPYMDITGMTQADFKIVEVSDDIRNKLTDLALKKLVSNNGMSDGEEESVLKRSYIASVPGKDRINVGWTLDQIYLSEARRLQDYVKSKVPGWQAGQAFDKSIMADYVSGGLDIKT